MPKTSFIKCILLPNCLTKPRRENQYFALPVHDSVIFFFKDLKTLIFTKRSLLRTSFLEAGWDSNSEVHYDQFYLYIVYLHLSELAMSLPINVY